MVWRSVKAGYLLAFQCIGALPGATAWAIACSFLADAASRHFARGEHGSPLWAPVLCDVLLGVAVSPYAILIHRRIIVGDMARSVLAAATWPRTWRFAIAAAVLCVVGDVGTTMLLLPHYLEDPSEGHRVGWMILALIALIVALWALVRTFLVFPAIAIDAPVRDSIRDTRGFGLTILGIWIVTIVPMILISVVLYQILGLNILDDFGFLSDVASAAVTTFAFAVAVASASYLFATRDEWADRPIAPEPA
jgi:hypothetical protein